MQTYRGTVREGVVRLPEGVELPDGQAVEVRVVLPSDSPHPSVTDDEATRERELEDEFAKHLLEIGLISRIPNPDPYDPPGRRPIKVRGKPVSEIIIEERR